MSGRNTGKSEVHFVSSINPDTAGSPHLEEKLASEERIRNLLSGVPEAEQRIVLLHFLEEMSGEEIAEQISNEPGGNKITGDEVSGIIERTVNSLRDKQSKK